MPGRYVPILHQRPPEQEPRERPPCSVRNNRVSSTCPEFHGNDLFEHTYTYTRCAPSVFQLTYFADKKESSLNNPTDSQVLRDLKKKIIYSIIFKEQHILLFPSKNTYPIFLVPNDCYPILLPSKILLHAKGTICSRDTDTFG